VFVISFSPKIGIFTDKIAPPINPLFFFIPPKPYASAGHPALKLKDNVLALACSSFSEAGR